MGLVIAPIAWLFGRYPRFCSLLYWTITTVGVLWIVGVFVGVLPYRTCPEPSIVACDARGFWSVDDSPYVWSGPGVFRYSPIAYWALQPFQLLPWEAFLAIWVGLHIAALLWLRAGWLLIFPGPVDDVFRGNINVFLAVFLVLALRKSAVWWTPVLLTKVAPGIGVAWHLARREWRQLGLAIGVTAGVVGLGFAIGPDLWIRWIGTLLSTEETYEIGNQFGPTPVRLALTSGIVAVAAFANWIWVVPIAMVISLPGLWPSNWALLTAIPRLLTPQRHTEDAE